METISRPWYVFASVDLRVTTNPRQPVTYWLVTYRAPDDTIETRFVYEQVGVGVPPDSEWQRIVREHRAKLSR